ncbi:hypothetical protein [Wolbachia endosymbiont of Litomosoides brasiliensis]|nr:hypothetical protein [Wolbachia endosymbiont of Litomosoides brasiliensis]
MSKSSYSASQGEHVIAHVMGKLVMKDYFSLRGKNCRCNDCHG